MTIKIIKNGVHLVRFTVMINIRLYQKFLLVILFRVANGRCGKSDIKIFLTTVFIPIFLSRISQSSYNGRPKFQ